jgi:hypothetical protein
LFGILLFGLICLSVPASAQQRPAVVDDVAKTFGFDSFGQIDAIRYTISIELGPKIKLKRSWVWEPKTDTITYDGPGPDKKPFKVTYKRSELASQDAFVKEKIDPAFYNDQYWLLFPFHMVWDTGATIEDAGMKQLPIGGGSAKKIVVKYPSQGGYLPGDTWILFVGTDNRVQQLEFHRGGDTKPSVVKATWTGYKKAGPLLVSLGHKGTADGQPFSLSFSDVAVKTTGSNDWTEAK